MKVSELFRVNKMFDVQNFDIIFCDKNDNLFVLDWSICTNDKTVVVKIKDKEV